MTRRLRSIGIYLAVLAMALNALWPLIAQAKPRSVTLVPVCTVQGVTHYIEMPGGASPLEQKSSSQHEHCSYCSFGGERAILPSLDVKVAAADIARPCRISVDETVFLKSTDFAAGRPRAPPVLPLVQLDPPIHDEYGRTHEEAFALRHRGDRAGAAVSGRGILRLGILHD
jgi:hypothetical protein